MVDIPGRGDFCYLFVYGSLRRGLSTPVLGNIADRIKWVGFGQVSGKLYDLGDFPGAIPSNDEGAVIKGEVFRLEDPEEILEILDEYEDFIPGNRIESLFIREMVRVLLDDGTLEASWIYWYNKEVSGTIHIHENDYLHYLKKNKRGTSYGAL